MRFIRSLGGVVIAFGVLAACVSDTASAPGVDAGIDSASGGSSSGDSGGADTSTSSSSSSSGGPDGGNLESPNLGCAVMGSHSVLHVSASSATVDAQGKLLSWRNLSGPEVGQPDGLVGELVRRDLGGKPAIFFDNFRANSNAPYPDRRVRFTGVGRIVSGGFALFVVGSHKYDFSPTYDASSIGVTYLFSGGTTSRLQLMGRYHTPDDKFEGFGALFYTDADVKNHVGVYSASDFIDQQHIFEVVDTKGPSDYTATLTVDGTAMPPMVHASNRFATSGTVITLGAGSDTHQMLAGTISELILLSQPDPGEIDCVRQRLKTKYAK